MKSVPNKKHAAPREENALKILSQLHFKYLQAKHPNMPAHTLPRRKFSDKTANELTKSILAYVKYIGGYCVRVTTTGMYRNGQWTHGTTRKGTADLHAVINGKHISIEVKIGKDRQSAAQKATEADVKGSGGAYIIARTFKAFYDEFNNLNVHDHECK